MTSEEEYITVKELAQFRKQVKGFCSALKTENQSIGNQIASMITLVAKVRTEQLGISLIIEELEKKLNKK